ncbi:Ppx/GppA family phosphatase [Siculibacillus lacustris]|uniref:Ppx/GppA family phosphatase n=1 Tax=Siculibacillus lacustris TaxID=1549641 RepID=A0A4Q9VY29_9HYPH|nr:Ppx/GppA phosphatase family protein [Siculibacillus lacustris]TBW40872.1 Ppx/GppA family phosphatase [Siculibacillus lacustris]
MARGDDPGAVRRSGGDADPGLRDPHRGDGRLQSHDASAWLGDATATDVRAPQRPRPDGRDPDGADPRAPTDRGNADPHGAPSDAATALPWAAEAPEPGGADPLRGEPVPRRVPAGRARATGPLYAALDLGTNNCRLLVAEPWHQGFRVVDAFSRIVRLGEGLSRSGRLSEAAQDRAIDALKVCRGKLDGRGIVRSRLVATEACRAAENGAEFLDRVEREAGLRLEILTRETEARLAVAGCANLIDWSSDGALLFDIGGGSSELVWLEFGTGRRYGSDPTRHIRAWTSLPVGVVTLSERHGGVAVGPQVFEDMVADVDDLLAGLTEWRGLEARLGPGRYHMLGTSGTVTTLAGVHLGLKRYDRRRVDGTWLSDFEVGEMIDQLLAMDFDDRVANPCIGLDRADLVLAGCAILEAIRRRWRCDRLRVADRGLREGMLTELMMGDGIWRRPSRGARSGRGEGSGT